MKIIMIVAVTMFGGYGEIKMSDPAWETVEDCLLHVPNVIDGMLEGGFFKTAEVTCREELPKTIPIIIYQ